MTGSQNGHSEADRKVLQAEHAESRDSIQFVSPLDAMNWAPLRYAPWLDTRAKFVSRIPPSGRLLDLGSSDGETLRHIAELRPDLHLFAEDIAGHPHNYPSRCEFHRADLEKEKLPWAACSMDAITCMHLVEHLSKLDLLLQEVSRLLKPDGRAYFETPHPKTLSLPSLRGKSNIPFTMNFYDDSTHKQLVTIAALAELARHAGLEVTASGTSRNWVFAAAYLFFCFLPPSRKKFTARVHWLGWSAYLIVRRSL